jgi:hypothetical protein
MVDNVLWVGEAGIDHSRLGHNGVDTSRQTIDVLRSKHLTSQSHFAQQHHPGAIIAQTISVSWTATTYSPGVVVALGRVLSKVNS